MSMKQNIHSAIQMGVYYMTLTEKQIFNPLMPSAYSHAFKPSIGLTVVEFSFMNTRMLMFPKIQKVKLTKQSNVYRVQKTKQRTSLMIICLSASNVHSLLTPMQWIHTRHPALYAAFAYNLYGAFTEVLLSSGHQGPRRRRQCAYIFRRDWSGGHLATTSRATASDQS